MASLLSAVTPLYDLSRCNSQDQYDITALTLIQSVFLERIGFLITSALNIHNDEKIIHSPGGFGHMPSVISPIWPIVIV